MKNKLEDYILKIDNFLSKELCKKTILGLKKIDWLEHEFSQTGPVNISHEKPIRGDVVHLNRNEIEYKDGELNVSYGYVSTRKKIMDKLHLAIQKYMDHLNFKWYKGWSGYTDIRFNRYIKDKVMTKHCDHINTMFDGEVKGIPTLSIIGTLNDNYTGGELIFFDDTHIKLKAGELIIFPSNFIYPHEVKPVKKGIRYSYVSWVF